MNPGISKKVAQFFVLTLTVLLAWQAKELAVEDALPRAQGLVESAQWVSGICSQNPKCPEQVS
jgi:hypothetical protein